MNANVNVEVEDSGTIGAPLPWLGLVVGQGGDFQG